MTIRQWDIVKARINEKDRDEHPAIVISPPEVCANPAVDKINVLYCTKLPSLPIILKNAVGHRGH